MSEPGKVGPAADEQKQEKARKGEKLERQLDAEALESVMGTKPGRRFIWRLLGDCGLYETSVRFEGQAVHPVTTVFNEGRRQVALELLARLTREAGPLYLDMCQENQTVS